MLHHKLKSTNSLTSTGQTLSSNLKSLAPNNSEVVQIITYSLIATAVVGIAVYHYIKQAEKELTN
jgi:hypothetical protein